LALAVGMKVVISPKSNFFRKHQQLPENVVGEVIGYNKAHVYRWDVQWVGNWNSYEEEDLIIVHEGGFTEDLSEWL